MFAQALAILRFTLLANPHAMAEFVHQKTATNHVLTPLEHGTKAHTE